MCFYPKIAWGVQKFFEGGGPKKIFIAFLDVTWTLATKISQIYSTEFFLGEHFLPEIFFNAF